MGEGGEEAEGEDVEALGAGDEVRKGGRRVLFLVVVVVGSGARRRALWRAWTWVRKRRVPREVVGY